MVKRRSPLHHRQGDHGCSDIFVEVCGGWQAAASAVGKGFRCRHTVEIEVSSTWRRGAARSPRAREEKAASGSDSHHVLAGKLQLLDRSRSGALVRASLANAVSSAYSAHELFSWRRRFAVVESIEARSPREEGGLQIVAAPRERDAALTAQDRAPGARPRLESREGALCRSGRSSSGALVPRIHDVEHPSGGARPDRPVARRLSCGSVTRIRSRSRDRHPAATR